MLATTVSFRSTYRPQYATVNQTLCPLHPMLFRFFGHTCQFCCHTEPQISPQQKYTKPLYGINMLNELYVWWVTSGTTLDKKEQ